MGKIKNSIENIKNTVSNTEKNLSPFFLIKRNRYL